MDELNHTITIEVIKGGFVLHYPKQSATSATSALGKFGLEAGQPLFNQVREIFTSSRKMNQRIKEVLEAVSTTPVESE